MALLQLDPLPEALDLDHLEDLEMLDLLQPGAPDLEEREQNLSSSAAVARMGTKHWAGPMPSLGMPLDLIWLDL